MYLVKFLNNLTNNSRQLTLGSAAVFLLLISVSASLAQRRAADTNTVAGNEEIHGTVKFPPGDVSGVQAMVILRSLSSPEMKAATNQDGEFRFSHLRPDQYTIIVDAGDAFEKETETVSVGFSGAVPAQGNPFSYSSPAVYEVRIYLRPKRLNSLAGPITVSELSSAKVPSATKKLFQQALDDQRAGKHPQAIEQLKTVISQAPNFMPAYRELGAEYLKTGEAQLAIGTFQNGLKIAPDDSALRLNYGIALLNQKQFADAESELRQSIKKGNEYSVAANYYLGVTLLAEHKTEEARTIFEDMLKNGGDKLPLVHRYLGGIYLQDKQYRKAANELDKYLKLEPNAADAGKIRETIKESRSKG